MYQLVILIILTLVGILNSINFMDTYSEKAVAEFKSKRNITWIVIGLILALLSFGGLFNDLLG